MPKLTIKLPEGNEYTHELTEGLVTIGRLPDNVLQIEHASVSSHHAQLTLMGGDYHLKDLNSTNGTRVNNHTHGEWQLQDGDHIRFGKVEAVYHSEIPADARPMPKQASGPSSAPASSSHRPADFANESPFKKKSKKKDPVSTAVLSFAVLAILSFVGAVVSIFMLKPPQ